MLSNNRVFSAGCLVALVELAAATPPSAAATPPSVAASQESMSPRTVRLEVGQSHTFGVAARNFYNASSVCLEAGAHYEFCVARNDAWYDAKIRCFADGWTAKDTRPAARPIVRALESKRRCPSADWFELVGSVRCDGCEYFRIGCRGAGWTYTPAPRRATLCLRQ